MDKKFQDMNYKEFIKEAKKVKSEIENCKCEELIPRAEYVEMFSTVYCLDRYNYNPLIDILEVFIVSKYLEIALQENKDYKIEKNILRLKKSFGDEFYLVKFIVTKGIKTKEENSMENELFAGYDMARLISHHMLKEGTYIQQYINGEPCNIDGLYVIKNKTPYSIKVFSKCKNHDLYMANMTNKRLYDTSGNFIDKKNIILQPNEEMNSSLLCDDGISFRVIEHRCEQCSLPILYKEEREKFHGCCSSECEKEKINKKEKSISIKIDNEIHTFPNKAEAKTYLIEKLDMLETLYKNDKEWYEMYKSIDIKRYRLEQAREDYNKSKNEIYNELAKIGYFG